MSIILQIGAPHVSCVAPVKCSEAIMGAGSEPKSMEAPLIPEECNVTQPSANTGYSNCFGLPYQDHNYGAPPPPTPPQSPAKLNGPVDEDTSTSVVTTSTTNEEDGAEEESITRCICEFDHDDEYMICCDKCSVWQHVDCMGLDRNNIPETYMCEKCEPRKVDRQKAKALQTKKREEMTADSSSDESGDENSQFKSSLPHSTSTSATTKGKKLRRKMRERLEEKIPVTPTKKVKRGKEKPEPRKIQTKKRVMALSVTYKHARKSKSSEVAHIDEDARDSWDSSILDYKQTYEEAETNQYSPEVHLQLTNLKLNGQHEEFVRKVSEHLRMSLCRVAEINKMVLAVFAVEDIMPNQIVCEYRGKFLLVSQFQQQNPVFNNKFHQYVLFYSFHKDQEDVCVDSREYGNDARFIRRSCSPNAEVRHVVENGSLHLYIVSISEIKQDEEITIPFDFNYESCIDKVECPCLKNNCPVNSLQKKNGQFDSSVQEKKCKKVKKVSVVVDDESTTYSSSLCSSSVIKAHKMSPLRLSQSNNQSQITASPEEGSIRNDSGLISEVDNGNPATPSSIEIETEEQAAERRKKMTREERKMEAIMKAFARLEKAQQRRQEALARLAHKKEEQEQKRKEEEEKKKDTVEQPSEEVKQESESVACVNGSITTEGSSNSNGGTETSPSAEDSKAAVKPKGKGKKRKNSGNQMRRRTRMNSGGSDILSPDESTQTIVIQNTQMPTPCTTPTPPVSTPTPPAFNPNVPVPPSSPSPSDSSAVCGTSSSVNCMNFKFPKTKKLLMTEWFSEKTVEPITQPLTIKTEPLELSTASTTCYMRSARSPTGINTAHLRRSSGGSGFSGSKQAQTDSSLGSAKKRWLRQAMCEEVTSGEQALPLPNGAMSPTHECNSPSTSPPVAPDLVTPLKKRRLARESMSSDTFPSTPPSTPSPSISGVNDLVGGDGTSLLGDPEDDEAQSERSSTEALPSNLVEETRRLKTNIPEDNVYGDYFKKDSSGEKLPQDEVAERDSIDVVYNTNIAMESQEHLAQNPVNLSVACNNVHLESEENGTISSSCGENVCKNVDSDNRLESEEVSETKPYSSNNVDQIDQRVINSSASPEIVECSGSEDLNLCPSTSREEDVKTSDKTCSKDASSSENKVDSANSSERNSIISLALVDSSTSDKSERENTKVSSTVDNQKDANSSGKTIRQNQKEASTGDTCTKECQKDSPTKASSSVSELHSSSTNSAAEEGQCKTVESSSPGAQTENKPDSSTSSVSTSSSSVSSTHLNNPQSTESKTCGSNNEASSFCYQSVSSSPITSSLSLSPSDSKIVSTVSSVSETSSDSDVSNSQITSTYTVNSGISSSPPAPSSVQITTTKRKVSLLEYRKRKLEGQSGKSAATSTSTTTISSTLVTSPNDVPKDINPPPRLSTLPLFESTSPVEPLKNDENNQKRDAKMNLKEDVRWNSAPTTLEQQRENLTQRLKREFGLVTDEDSDSEKDKIIPEGVEDGFVRTQNGRPIGCYPSHPPNPQQSLVRKGTPTVVRNIPTIIGITGFQSQSRPLPPSPAVPGVQPALPPPPQQYTYQQFSAHTTNYTAHPQGTQQALPPPQYASPQIVTQYNGPPPQMTPQGQPRPSMPMRPPLATPSPCSIVPALVVPPATQPPPLSHVQQQTLIRPTRPPLIQSFTENQHRYSAPPPPRPQTYYNQSYYPQ